MTFRRVKPSNPWQQLAAFIARKWPAFGHLKPTTQQLSLAVSGGLVVLTVIVGFVVANQGDGDTSEPTASPTQAAGVASEGPLEAPSQAPEPVETEPEAGTYTYQSRDPATEQTDADSQESDDTGVLTVENNPELAALLSGPATGDNVNAFSQKYRVQVVEFDGFVADVYINPREHNGESTINVMAGDAGDSTHNGPVFQLGWYGHESPLEDFSEGDNVRVTALVGAVYGFEPHQFFLVEGEGVASLTRR
ncbi:DUF4839 domain-containing protein [Geodermatophilus sp. CPCC 205506]|uniref:DUF4839 domain-containing protein n=1 Tax=Geodermatophilus sp. CPCC 205506 TaxID=2936596 RepID=UPI003F52C2A4